ncbi:glycosyl hydrolase family 88 [Emticicia sp. CRIBPO]|uniref:glycoside hydrolase family 88 protein n=1 Tax=Emticicia sp. CRIBPO TaxID=2683258 RepID=UPI0014130A14|nr:glycoside hydrolase family 88 protein [Emticicia sp. CRIBPO]NBA85260.1 glycosyl hydrolase family 88 [Emticicia sp. CRIBPO]
MNRSIIYLFISALSFIAVVSDPKETQFIDENFSHATGQLKRMLKAADPQSFPRTLDQQGALKSTNMYDWTSGFFPGNLWYAYEYSGDPELKSAAIAWTEKLEPLKDFREHHDLGFMMYCSYGNAYRLTGNEAYKAILIQAARSLSTRFSTQTGSIKSWNRFVSWNDKKTFDYPVIIDNMMNLELLFFASKVSGDDTFRKIALTHAGNVLKNQVRKDYSHYHVVNYDAKTGKVVSRQTAQGYADNSTWSRGQAWGIYGFTVMYRETRDRKYLLTAQKMADFFLNHENLPADKVPYWDFDVNKPGFVPGPNAYTRHVAPVHRDASAAAITASALLELANYDPKTKARYHQAATQMLHTLSGPLFRAEQGDNANFILKHSVGSIPHKAEIDVPLVYADYYFLEALLRYKKILE